MHGTATVRSKSAISEYFVESEREAEALILDEHRRFRPDVRVTLPIIPGATMTLDTIGIAEVARTPRAPRRIGNGTFRPSRQEYWEYAYETQRYLDLLTNEELQERFVDVFINLWTLAPSGKIAPRFRGSDEAWTWKFQHLMMETGRGYLHQDVILRARELIHATYPKRPLGADTALLPRINDSGFLFKFGQRKHLVALRERGEILLSGRKSYRRAVDAARKDQEGVLVLHTPEGARMTIRNEIDAYVYCTSRRFEPRLFYDFPDVDACAVITDPVKFAGLLRSARKRCIVEAAWNDAPVTYVDPVLYDPTHAGDLIGAKHFRYSYQQEHRFTMIPTSEGNGKPEFELPQLEINLGDLRSMVYLVE